MTRSGSVKTDKATYEMIQGYVLVKPLADQFKTMHPDAKLKRIDNWSSCNKKLITALQSTNPRSESPLFIAIEGSKEIKGTYFRPDIVLDVLEWLCPAFKTEIHTVYENYVVEQNALI